MKKLDLHLHTIGTKWDTTFTFDLGKLKEYVSYAKIDCIAVTNHNLFDINQFYEIGIKTHGVKLL